MTQTVWTPRLVDRTPQFIMEPSKERKCYWLAIRAEYEAKHDTFSFTVDGHKHSWYRRGMPYFDNRNAAVQYAKSEKGHGWPLG